MTAREQLTGKAGLIVFLAVQVLAVVFWVLALLPNIGPGADPLVESAQQIWSGGGHSIVESDFRSGRNIVGVGRFHPVGDLATFDLSPLLIGTLLMALAGAGAAAAIYLFKSKVLVASAAAIVALLAGLGGCLFIAMQWLGDTAFPPGFPNAYLLNALTRAFLLQVALGFVFLAVPSILAIAGVVTRERPLGFRWAALNWVIVAAVWVVFYLACHVALFPFGDEAWQPI
jgi:heme/copper-type cytochrome/quinol oxidase subunit 3